MRKEYLHPETKDPKILAKEVDRLLRQPDSMRDPEERQFLEQHRGDIAVRAILQRQQVGRYDPKRNAYVDDDGNIIE
jgi:hypothetical protein